MSQNVGMIDSAFVLWRLNVPRIITVKWIDYIEIDTCDKRKGKKATLVWQHRWFFYSRSVLSVTVNKVALIGDLFQCFLVILLSIVGPMRVMCSWTSVIWRRRLLRLTVTNHFTFRSIRKLHGSARWDASLWCIASRILDLAHFYFWSIFKRKKKKITNSYNKKLTHL